MTKRVMKYMTRIGQKTGMLKNSKKVQPKPISVAFVAEYQNLNSGSRRMKGRNSSFCLVGSASPSSARLKRFRLSLSSFFETQLGSQMIFLKITYHLLLRALPLPGLSWAWERRAGGSGDRWRARTSRCTSPAMNIVNIRNSLVKIKCNSKAINNPRSNKRNRPASRRSGAESTR